MHVHVCECECECECGEGGEDELMVIHNIMFVLLFHFWGVLSTINSNPNSQRYMRKCMVNIINV